MEQLKEWFTGYVRTFYTPDDAYLNNNIHLKECHTRRVCAEMRDLTAALSMNSDDAVLAETIALLHDTGRFEQFTKYRTYKDAISENHSLLGLRIIADNRLLDGLAGKEQTLIRQAIEFHGAKELPAMEERTLHFARMIRDVDKLDIYKLCVENYHRFHVDKQSFAYEVEFADAPETNPAIIDAILNHQLIDYRLLKTLTDAKLLQLGWVFDTYFDWTLRQMRDRGYLDGIIRWLPDTEPVQRAVAHIRASVADRLS